MASICVNCNNIRNHIFILHWIADTFRDYIELTDSHMVSGSKTHREHLQIPSLPEPTASNNLFGYSGVNMGKYTELHDTLDVSLNENMNTNLRRFIFYFHLNRPPSHPLPNIDPHRLLYSFDIRRRRTSSSSAFLSSSSLVTRAVSALLSSSRLSLLETSASNFCLLFARETTAFPWFVVFR